MDYSFVIIISFKGVFSLYRNSKNEKILSMIIIILTIMLIYTLLLNVSIN